MFKLLVMELSLVSTKAKVYNWGNIAVIYANTLDFVGIDQHALLG